MCPPCMNFGGTRLQLHLIRSMQREDFPGNLSLRSACTNTSKEQTHATRFQWSAMNGVNNPPVPPEQRLTGLAIFLAARGPYAWIGHGWQGTCNSKSPFPDELAQDYGEPLGLCEETVPGKSGIFKRSWTKSIVTVDCNTFVGSIDTHPLVV